MDDLDRIMDIMEEAFDPAWGEAWNRRQVEDSLGFPTTHSFVMSADGGRPGEGDPGAGFILSRSAPGEEELLLVGVRPEHRRRGLGRKMIDRLCREAAARGAERLFLEMRSNNPAITLYRSIGFDPIGRRRDYYLLADGSRLDAITFGLTLGN